MGQRVLKTAFAVALCAAWSTVATGEEDRKVQFTFLDTLNKGKEMSISNADFPAQPSAVIQRPTEPAADTVAQNTALKTKQQPGIVVSRFRIQVVASTSQEQVNKVKSALSSKLQIPVSIAFESPYYKLFAGEFAERSEAENYLAQVKKLGYNDAWISRIAASGR